MTDGRVRHARNGSVRLGYREFRIRAGMHTGEVERRGAEFSGLSGETEVFGVATPAGSPAP